MAGTPASCKPGVLKKYFVFSSLSKWAVGGDGRAYRYRHFESDGLQSGKNCKMVMFLGIVVVVISENMLWSRNLGKKMWVFREAPPPPPRTSIRMYAVT